MHCKEAIPLTKGNPRRFPSDDFFPVMDKTGQKLKKGDERWLRLQRGKEVQKNKPTSYGMNRIVGENRKFLRGLCQCVIPGYYNNGSPYNKDWVVYKKLMPSSSGALEV